MRKYLYFLVVFIFSCSYSDDTIMVTNSGEAQGTFYHIKYMSSYGEDYQFQIDSILLEVDSSLSIYKDYSLIYKLNNGENLKTDTLFNVVFAAANKVFLETQGNFDCSVSPLVNAWGFYTDSLGHLLNIDSTKFREILPYIGFQKMKLIGDSLVKPKDMILDFNSIAQGFTIELIANFLQSKRIQNYLIELGGEVLAKGINADERIWRIGVDKPVAKIDYSQRFQFILELENKALATSGNYRKFYIKDGVKYSHIINPFTGFPAHNSLLSATVIHDNCMMADAYATAFMVMGLNKTKSFVQEYPDIEIYLVYTSLSGEWETYISPKMLERINF
ncbi:MAG: thiamine biosynthesis protein ApbE [Flavobacteriales bacterium]|nr:thiamine biosynthesis protein ApbE [Flavobacteriales bacterium]